MRLSLAITLCIVLFAAPSAAQQQVFPRLTEREYQKKFDDLVPKGYIATGIRVYVQNNEEFFDLTMEIPDQPIRWASHHAMSDTAFAARQKLYQSRGMQLELHRTYRIDDTRLHVAIWKEQPSRRLVIWKDASKMPARGKTDPELQPVDQMMTSFLSKHQLPGATIAITRNGKLVYSRAFGYRDVANRKPMQNSTLMRIASISKPITAVAILKLIEQGKLRLSDKVFEILPYKTAEQLDQVDPRMNQITIQHLLVHSAGYDRGKSFDPMFRSRKIAEDLDIQSPAGPDAVIRYMLERPLDHEPGKRYAYSNFGYCLLGRVIERISGQTYEKYVQNQVLKPLKITRMKVGSSQPRQQHSKEAHYYENPKRLGPSVFGPDAEPYLPGPYGCWHLEAMDSHGGWIATAEDLVRFASALDDPGRCPILSADSIETMFSAPAGDIWPSDKYFYACGWLVRPTAQGLRTTWHSGSLPGTSSILVRRRDGFNWTVIFNSRDCNSNGQPAGLIDAQVHRAVNAVKQWPSIDLFKK